MAFNDVRLGDPHVAERLVHSLVQMQWLYLAGNKVGRRAQLALHSMGLDNIVPANARDTPGEFSDSGDDEDDYDDDYASGDELQDYANAVAAEYNADPYADEVYGDVMGDGAGYYAGQW